MRGFDKKLAAVRGSVTTTVLNTIFKEIDNMKPDVSRLVKKIDHDAKYQIFGKIFYDF